MELCHNHAHLSAAPATVGAGAERGRDLLSLSDVFSSSRGVLRRASQRGVVGAFFAFSCSLLPLTRNESGMLYTRFRPTSGVVDWFSCGQLSVDRSVCKHTQHRQVLVVLWCMCLQKPLNKLIYLHLKANQALQLRSQNFELTRKMQCTCLYFLECISNGDDLALYGVRSRSSLDCTTPHPGHAVFWSQR